LPAPSRHGEGRAPRPPRHGARPSTGRVARGSGGPAVAPHGERGDALTTDEQDTLAILLGKMATAQAAHDETLLDQPDVRSSARRIAAQRTREFRGRGGAGGHRGPAGAGWKEHFEAHRQEIRSLKEELARVRDEIKAQARRPVDEAKAAKAEVKAEVKGVRDEVVNHLKGGRRRR
jgi:hypothetical protein